MSTPIIYVVMVLYGVADMAKQALLSVHDFSTAFSPTPHIAGPGCSLQFIIVDNASPEKLDYPTHIGSPIILAPKTNLGYPKGANLGIECALFEHGRLERRDREGREAYILLMNPDVVMHERLWDKILIDVMHARDCNIIGFHHIRPRKGSFTSEVLPKHHYVGGYFLLGELDVWKKIGTYDEGFGMGYYEDRDWCYRAQEAGYRICRVSGIDLDHAHNSSFRAAGVNPNEHVATSHYYFYQKWAGTRLNEHLGKSEDW